MTDPHDSGNATGSPQPGAPADTTGALRALPPPTTKAAAAPPPPPHTQTVMNGTPAQAQPMAPQPMAQPSPIPGVVQPAQPVGYPQAYPPQAGPRQGEDFDARATTQAPQRQPMQSVMPTAASIPPPNMPPKRATQSKGNKGLVIALAALVTVLVIGAGGFGVVTLARRGGVDDAIVRVATDSGSGTGFFIEGPDDFAYVATAFHVVERGERILIERNVPADGDTHFVEAYPETEVVAFDADADIAILRIRNLEGGHFSHLSLAEQPAANEPVKSYGFPGSKITRRTGLIAKDGKLLSLVKFPVYDRRNKKVIRDNAIDGLLVSTDIEPGFSGGPTVNEDGEVVGINVTKDLVHRGQDGVVHVKLLKSLLEQVKPVEQSTEPSADEVAKLLESLQRDVLLLPVKDRLSTREHAFLSTGELPRLRKLINEIRRNERDSVIPPGRKLSGRAALGMWAAQLPGKPLETYLDGDVQEAIQKCELSSARLVSLFSDVADNDEGSKAAEKAAALQMCDELALRPVAWDLLAATLQWNGKERSYSVTKVERVDEDSDVFRAMVKVDGLDNLLPLWVGYEYGKLSVKLFDNEGKLYGVKSAGKVQGSELEGEWELKRPRAPAINMTDAESESTEVVSLSVRGNGDVTVRHEVQSKLYNTARGIFRCSGRREIESGMIQSFSGKLENGVVLAKPKDDAKPTGPDQRCKWGYRADAMVAFKRLDDKLMMVRTDGVGYPETVELTRKKDEVKDEE